MRFLFSILFVVAMHIVSFAQVRLSIPVGDTLVHFMAKERAFINTGSLRVSALQNKPAVPLDFYARNLGFFCTQELRMQQVHVPITFRVGTMDQCNYLEQKPGYR